MYFYHPFAEDGVVARTAERVYRVIAHVFHVPEDAEDFGAVQEAFRPATPDEVAAHHAAQTASATQPVVSDTVSARDDATEQGASEPTRPKPKAKK